MPRSICSRICALAGVVAIGGMLAALHPGAAEADQLTAKDVQIVGRALGFLDPPPHDATVGIVYAPASKAEADAIVAAFGDGVKGGSSVFKAKLVELASVGSVTGLAALIATTGTAGDAVMAAAKAQHIPCVTADAEQVKAGHCVMSVRSDPKVDITLSHAAAEATGVGFGSAFRMMIHEI